MNEVFLLGTRDSLKINFLREIADGGVTLRVQLNGETPLDMRSEILSDGGRMHVMGKFNISKSSDGGTLTIRPVAAADTLRLYISISESIDIGGKNLSIYRGISKSTETELPLKPDISMLELSPNDEGSVALRIFRRNASSDDVVSAAQSELADIELAVMDTEKKTAELEILKSKARERLEAVEREYSSDHEKYLAELADLRSQMSFDEAVMEHYSDADITPTAELFDVIRSKLDEAEAQIRIFIEAKQNKSMEIENEIRSGNRV